MTNILLTGLGLVFLVVAGALFYRRKRARRFADLPDIPPFLRREGAPSVSADDSNDSDWTEIHPLPKTIRPQGREICSACEMGSIKTPGYDCGGIDIINYKDSPLREAMYRHMEEAEQGFITVMLNRLRRRLRNAAL